MAVKFETNLGVDLTVNEAEFIKKFVSPSSGTYLNADRSAKSVGLVNAGNIMGRERVKRALARVFSEDFEIDEMIRAGVKERLRDSEHKEFLPTAMFVCKLRGDFVGEGSDVGGLSEAEREERLREVSELVQGDTIKLSGDGDVDDCLIKIEED